jgi:hypothetical protein
MWPLYEYMQDTKSASAIDIQIASGTRPMTDPLAISRFEELFGDESIHSLSSSEAEVR